MKIAILDDYQNIVRDLPCFSLLGEHEVTVLNEKLGAEALIENLRGVSAIVLTRERTELHSRILASLPDLRVISQTGRPGEHVDVGQCTRDGIAVLAGSGSPVAPAELTWALVMAAQRRLPHYMASLQNGMWQSGQGLKGQVLSVGRGLKGAKLGVFGLGKIGALVASYGRAFGMEVLVFGQKASREKAQQLGYSFATDQRDLFQQADVLCLHLRLSEGTRRLINEQDLCSMKPTATLVNTSRAQLIEEGAIERCLASGSGPFLFALDVFEEEPLPPMSTLLHHQRVIATPHIGFVEYGGYELYFRTAFQNLLDFFAGTSSSVFNPAVLSQVNLRWKGALR